MLQLTQVYLERAQKKALRARAKARGTNLAEEVRRAVDPYLGEVLPADLDCVNARRDAAFDIIDRMGRKRAAGSSA
jgi:hypothetical protein